MLAAAHFAPARAPSPAALGEGGIARLALLGSGTVGQAVLERLYDWRATERGLGLRLVYAANTRLALHDSGGLCPADARIRLVEAARNAGGCEPGGVSKALGGNGVRILIDATADAGVAGRHAALLRDGVHVATACKLATGTSLALWDEIRSASLDCGAGFGDRATVGAGLPLLRSIRELRAGATASTPLPGSCPARSPGCSTASTARGPFRSWCARRARRVSRSRTRATTCPARTSGARS